MGMVRGKVEYMMRGKGKEAQNGEKQEMKAEQQICQAECGAIES
jgi:hypothetical protein